MFLKPSFRQISFTNCMLRCDQLYRHLTSIATTTVLSPTCGKCGHAHHFRTQRRFYTNRNLLWLKERGLIADMFPANSDQAFASFVSAKPQTLYAGFDPTAESLHVGNLAVLIMLLHSQRAGHHPIALVGGATGRIGDPSGRNSERSALEEEVVTNNVDKIIQNLKTVAENHELYFWDNKKGTEPLPKFMIVNNYDWYKNISSLEFVGKIGRHFRMGTMLLKDAVKSRLNSEDGLSFTEFAYQIFQAYDWYHLLKHFGCYVQVGGSDQMGNILAGHDLISRTLKKQVYGVTVPIVTTESGNKYGKSAGNAVWLDGEKTSAFDFYQFFVRSNDSELGKLLRIFTFRTEQEIEALLRRHEKSPERREGQKELASDVTLLVHGEEGLEQALQATEALYSENLEALGCLKAEDVVRIFQSGAGGNSYLSELILQPGTTILDMALKARCFNSERDAMRIIGAGGFFLNHRKVLNWEEMVVPGVHILPNKISLARVGKKNYYLIKWSP